MSIIQKNKFKLTFTKADGTVKELKMKKKMCSNNKSMLDSFLKFQLLKDSKSPSNEWCQSKTTSRTKLWSKTKQPTKLGGIGIPCGEKNDCFVVDLDNYKWDDNHPFTKKFGKDNLVNKFDTYIQKSAGGGLHLFFKYDKEFFNKCNNTLGIDILSDINSQGEYKGKYVVGAGSTLRFTADMQKKYKTKAKFGTYKILNDRPVIECPEELKQWLRDNIYINEDVVRKKKQTDNKKVVVSNTPEYYKYNLSELRVSMICEDLYKKAPQYFTKYRDDEDWSWLVFTTAMKAIGHYKMWDKYSKKYGGVSYNKTQNDKIWNGITEYNKLNCFNKILLAIGERTLLDYVKYKPIREDKLKFTKEGEWDKLSKHLKLPQTDVQIKSDTGTGKTTIVAEHFKKNKHMKFLSIVSRKSLGYGQYVNFKDNFDLDCVYYEEFEKMLIPKDNNVVIQIDSIMKIQSYKEDIHEYTIFLDEYSSLIEHLITSPTLNKTRAVVFKLFKYIITNARQVICVDADLNKHTLDFLKLCERPINIWNNTFIHNKGVPVKEWSNTTDMINEMKKKDKFLCCLDSRTMTLSIPEEHFNSVLVEKVNENEVLDIDGNVVNKYSYSIYKDEKGHILVITSDNDIIPDNLENWPRIFISPKVIYGNDLNEYERDVFCIYKEHTISPKAMVQQICRCRKIIQLNYLFLKKKFNEPNFIDTKDVYDWNETKEEFAYWREVFDDAEVVLFYKRLLAVIQYNNDCYETNKFVHFRNMLDKKGFKKVPSVVVQTSKKELAKLEEKQKEKEVLNFDVNHPKNIDRNGLLNLSEEDMKKYRLLFVRDTEWFHYKNTRDYLLETKNSLMTEIATGDDFNINKIKSNKNKLLIISRFMTDVGCKDKFDITPTKNLTDEEANKWYKELEIVFRLRMKEKPDLTISENVETVIIKCYKQLFGVSIKNYIDDEIKEIKLVNSRRRTINGVKQTILELNRGFFDEVNNIIKNDMPEFNWNEHLNFKDIEYNFDDDE
tara:strand:- start:19913 stop:22921 length:3009 start_codon:yes stop_codon:yes gene_type:complete